jgi:DNA-binding transcriptional LysR family regulator
VHVAASHTVIEVFLPRPLGAFRRRFPAVQVKLTLDNSAGVLAQVETGQVDFGIVEGRVGRTRELDVMNLWRDQLGLIVSSSHPLAERSAVSVEELSQQDLIVREEGSGTRRILESALRGVDKDLSELRVIMELSSVRAIVAMVRHDVGVGVLSHTLADDPQNGVCFVPIPELRLNRQIYLVSRTPNEHGPAAKELIADLRRDSARSAT